MCGFPVEPGGIFLSNTDCSVCSGPLLHSHCPQVEILLRAVFSIRSRNMVRDVSLFNWVLRLLTWFSWWMISVGPYGSSLEMLWASVASARSVHQSRESLGGCKHCISVPSVGIFKSCHRPWVFNCMGDTIPTFYISLRVKIPPYVQPWCSWPNVQWIRRLSGNSLTVTCHCKPTASQDIDEKKTVINFFKPLDR